MDKGRFKYAAAGLGVMLLAGVVYAWSVLSVPIAAEFPDWTKAKLSLTFTILMSCFCTGQVISGFIANLIKPRTGVWIGAALLLGGFLLSSSMQSAALLYLGFGVMCGLGSGIAYISVMNPVVKWYPEKKGLISGVLLMGFGFSSFLIGKVFQSFTPPEPGGWRGSFVVMGVVTFAVLFLCGFVIKKKPEEAGNPAAEQGLTTGQMLKKPNFWLYYFWAFAMTGAGLMIIGQASGIVSESVSGVTAASVATIVGLISIFNGVGRVVFGGMYDKAGRRASMAVVCFCFIAAMALAVGAVKFSSEAMIIASFCLLGLGYGGVPVCNSAFSASSFGMAHFQTNLPVCNSSMLPASFCGTLAAMIYDGSHSYLMVFVVIAAMALASLGASELITAIEKKGK